jgi:L-histidine N-alpha-methyltransferase
LNASLIIPGLGNPRYCCLSLTPRRQVPTMAQEVQAGLKERPRTISPKYFYDALGSHLFERICDTAEYYPSRAEGELLARHAEAIIAQCQPNYLIELGSGSSRKTRHLLDACERLGHYVEYWPLDVCQEMLDEAARGLLMRYPWLKVRALQGDYLAGLELPRRQGAALFMFLGGTLGNFKPAEAEAFLSELQGLMQPEDHFLLGADRIKDKHVLEAAYNDREGVTARFNLNVLEVINRELGADFDLSAFSHRAIFNEHARQIEMHLVARAPQEVTVKALDEQYRFEAGEYLLTEISRKFSREGLEQLLKQADMAPVNHFEGGEQLFSLLLTRSQV